MGAQVPATSLRTCTASGCAGSTMRMWRRCWRCCTGKRSSRPHRWAAGRVQEGGKGRGREARGRNRGVCGGQGWFSATGAAA